jgi:hypothetical protein
VFDAAQCELVHALRGHNAAVKALAVVHGTRALARARTRARVGENARTRARA